MIDKTPQSISPRPGRGHLMQLLELLARVSTIRNQSFESWITDATLSLNWGTTLIVITPNGNENVISALHQQVRRGFDINMLITEPFSSFMPISYKAKHLGISAFNVANRSDLINWSKTHHKNQL